MEVKTIRQLLKRYLLGNANNEETAVVENWYQSFEDDLPLNLSEQDAATTKLEIWEKIAPALQVEKKVWMLPVWKKVAACAAIVLAVGLTVFFLKNKQTGTREALTYTMVATQNGEKRSITIRDGTTLTLNAGTTIHVYDDFTKLRKVDVVDGEVFFDVQKDAQRPFLIQSGGLTITVLGTSFNVSSYKGLHTLSVGVVTGKVSVQKDTTMLGLLQKTEELVYDKDKGTYKTGTMDESLLAWKEGRLVLNDVTFSEMSFLMKKNFSIDIQTEDPAIEDTKYTTELLTTMTAGQAVEVLAAIHHLKIKQKNNQVFLHK